MNRVLISFFFYVILLSSCSTSDKKNELKTGDLLFKDTQNNKLASAIKEVTPSSKDYSFSHVGVVFFEDGDWKVIEAVPKVGVRIVSLSSFQAPAKGEVIKVVVGRLKPEYPFDIKELIDYGKAQVGKKYNDAFNWNDTTFYCSQLVYKMFEHAGQRDAFSPIPMTFKETNKDSFHPIWVRYFDNLGVAIPEGMLGINPNAMANASSVELLYELPY